MNCPKAFYINTNQNIAKRLKLGKTNYCYTRDSRTTKVDSKRNSKIIWMFRLRFESNEMR